VAATALGGGTTLYLYFSAPEVGGDEQAAGRGAYALVRGRL
jgi:hypothetical protein